MPAEVAPYGRSTQKAPAVKEVHVLWITAGLGCDGDSVPSQPLHSPASRTFSWERSRDFPRFTYTILFLLMKSATIS